MCNKAKEMNNRAEPGAEVLQVRVTLGNREQALQAHVFQVNGEDDSREGDIRLHCHLSCANFSVICETPTGCRTKRLSKEKCPITKHVGYHTCGLNQIMSKKST